jgi:hypothetical protein
MRLFGINSDNFTMVHVRRLYSAPGGAWHEAGPSEHISAGYDGGGGGHV